jgi:hypothetical protein
MPGKTTFSFRILRDAVRQRVEESSIRVVAEEIGMSASGLHVLLRGSKPHAATRAKLVDWYVATRGEPKGRANGVSPADVDVALRLLMLYATQDGRDSVQQRRVREIVRRFEAGVSEPGTRDRKNE